MKKAPKLLYRYMDTATAWECMKEGSLAFTPPGRFNDPFDTNPALDFTGCDQKRRRAMLKIRSAFMEGFIGVACFTSELEDALMWAHYGDWHRGVMLGFDTTHLTWIQRVRYMPQRPSVDSGASEVEKALLVKSSVWKREKEWRLTAQPSQCEVKMRGNTPIYIQRLNRKCFVSITFGCRADDSFVVGVENALKQWNMEHCLLRRLQLCDKTYEFRVYKKTVEGLWKLES